MLPAHWVVDWPRDDSVPDGPVLSCRTLDHEGVASLARAFARSGLAPWERANFPLGPLTVKLAAFPSLDELWTLHMLARMELSGANAPPSHWDAIVRYVEHAQLGYLLDKVAPERAIAPLYQSMVYQHLGGDAPNRVAFLEDALALCARLDERVASGAELLTEPHFDGDPRFARYLAMLEADHELYLEDRARGTAWVATIPEGKGRAAREVELLVLDRPVATQFKVWARRDEATPGGDGFALLVVRHESIVISADPLKRVRIDFLAAGLTALERARGGDGEWYDGRRHEGTLVVEPRGGTALSLDDVLAHLRSVLSLSPLATTGSESAVATRGGNEPTPGGATAPRRRGRVAALVGVAAMALSAGLWFARGWMGVKEEGAVHASSSPTSVGLSRSDEERGPRVRAGAKGEALPAEKVKAVASASGARPKYALLAGACSYTGERELRSPCRDARAVKKLLVERYGYLAENIVYLIDKSEPGEKTDGRPTAQNMKREVERFRERFGEHEDSSFLFYYSGHGGYVSGAHADYGVLQPSGFFDEYAKEPYSNRGWDMQTLIDDIKKGVPSRHLMLLIDACYSGWAGAKGDDELDGKVRALWNERAEVVLSAASKGQRAWEDEHDPRSWIWGGHSVLTAFLLQGLATGDGGKAPADASGDGIVTDEELASYLKHAVPDSVALNKDAAKQTPQFFRIDDRLPKSGQFLFVPKG